MNSRRDFIRVTIVCQAAEHARWGGSTVPRPAAAAVQQAEADPGRTAAIIDGFKGERAEVRPVADPLALILS